jgi:hypothetical protein
MDDPNSEELRLRADARLELQRDLNKIFAELEALGAGEGYTALHGPDGAQLKIWQLLQALEGALFDHLAAGREARAIERKLAQVREQLALHFEQCQVETFGPAPPAAYVPARPTVPRPTGRPALRIVGKEEGADGR